MLITPKCVGTRTLEPEALKKDYDSCRKYGPCGVGSLAVYLGSFYLSRRYYVPVRDIKRIFKRVALSKGGYTGQGLFGSMAYLVVELKNGQERSCRFKREAEVDELLAQVERQLPQLPTHSAKAEQKLRAAEAEERAKYLSQLSPEAAEAVDALTRAQAVLALSPTLWRELEESARRKRIISRITPGRRWGAIAIAALGLVLCLAGVAVALGGNTLGYYGLLIGGTMMLFSAATGSLPTPRNSPKYAQEQWREAVEKMADFLRSYPDFPLPAQFAHPTVLRRMERSLRQGRAQSVPEAAALVKKDLRALNNTVEVSQKEYDEVVAVKPLYIACDYADELTEERGK